MSTDHTPMAATEHMNAAPPSDSGCAFVIPCYNEAERLDTARFEQALRDFPALTLLFVDDGSTDRTVEVLNSILAKCPARASILSLTDNVGKAEAVRAGVSQLLLKEQGLSHIGYLDADLATSLHEGLEIRDYMTKRGSTSFAFGSRISKVGSVISRKASRHYIGRVVATVVSNILRLRVYDTQCGAKVLTKDLAADVFDQPFASRWLFDVEIFARILSRYGDRGEGMMVEYPLQSWIDQAGSKVHWSYLPKMLVDLWTIWRSYPALRSRQEL